MIRKISKYYNYLNVDYIVKQTQRSQKQINITTGLDKIQEYKRNWLQHITQRPVIDYRETKTTGQQTGETRGDH